MADEQVCPDCGAPVDAEECIVCLLLAGDKIPVLMFRGRS